MSLADEIREMLDGYVAAYLAGDAERCTDAFLDDALLSSHVRPPARGREAIAAVHREWLAVPSRDKAISLVTVGGDARHAWAIARYADTMSDGGVDRGLALLVFERQRGAWRIRACSLSLDEERQARALVEDWER